MSYDLLFLRDRASEALTQDRVADHLRGRPFYQEEGQQFWYQNDATGVCPASSPSRRSRK